MEALCGVPCVVVGRGGRLRDALQSAITLLNRVTFLHGSGNSPLLPEGLLGTAALEFSPRFLGSCLKLMSWKFRPSCGSALSECTSQEIQGT